MKIKRADGVLFEKMLRNGLNYLKQSESIINNMNVFPVPDGDTGSNMRLTLENGLKCAKTNAHLGEYALSLASGMLMGARGNSGVILSQIFKGFAEEIKRDSIVDAKEFTEGFIAGYKMAYQAVVKPVEGTLLTVAREGVEHIKDQTSRGMYIDNFLNIYIAEMKKTLAFTPELLPVLKEAGVVDSGGYGYIIIIEGMLKYLHEEIIDSAIEIEDVKKEEVNTFDEYSNFDYGYCMEFTLQLLASRIKIDTFNLDLFIKELNDLGESLVVVQDNSRLKVHIHTFKPSRIINYAQMFGEFVSFKLENMALQHAHQLKLQSEVIKTDLGKIAIVNGDDLKQIYHDLGCHIIIDGGKTMNTSSEEIINAINKIDADEYVVYTNNKNIELSCEQAIKVLGKNNIHIIRSHNVLEGYYALAMDEADNPNLEYRIKQMLAGLKAITTICYFKSNRDCMLNGVSINNGSCVAMMDDILNCDDNYIDCCLNSLKAIKNIKEKETCIVLTGKDFDCDEDVLVNAISANYPDLNVSVMSGSQQIYDLIIGLV